MLSRSFGSSRRKLRRSGMLAACTMGGTVTLMLCYLSVSGLVVIFVVLAYYCWTTNSTAVPELQLQLHCTALHTPSQHSTHPPSLPPPSDQSLLTYTYTLSSSQSVSRSASPAPSRQTAATAAAHPLQSKLLPIIRPTYLTVINSVCASPVRPALHPLPVLPGTPCPVRPALLLLLP